MFLLKNKSGRYLVKSGICPIWTDLPSQAKKFREFEAEKTKSLLKDMLGIDTVLEPLYWQSDPILRSAKCYGTVGHFDHTL